MAYFGKDTIIKSDSGLPIRIIEPLGGGGQGDVYLVEYKMRKGL